MILVYGLDGRPFIEEASYKVSLENLVEKVEKQEMEKVDVLPRQRRRRPCHGWISNNDEEELIELQPVAPFPEKLAKFLSMSRKKRWDVRPENMTFSVTLQ